MVVVTSPIGDQAPPAFAAITISPENHNLVSRFLITFCKIVINTMVAVRLSIIADKTKAKMEKITNSPFLDLVFNFKKLQNNGYNFTFLNQSLHSMLVFPFFLSLMTGIASILTMHAIRRSENFRFIIVGLVTCVIVYYLKDLSLALGKTGRIPITLSIWTPIIALSLFTFAGILQINEK